jgi:hypothetical protein
MGRFPALLPTHRLALVAAVALAAASLPAEALERHDGAWLHVAVDEAPPRGASVRVNLPLSLVEAALALMPEAGTGQVRVALDDSDLSLAELEARWRRLGGRSGTLLTVEERSLTTIVSRQGGFLVLDHHDRRHGDERVEVRIAAPVVDALFAGEGDRLDLGGALRALAAAGTGEVTARSDSGDRVRIWVDRSPTPHGSSGSRR